MKPPNAARLIFQARLVLLVALSPGITTAGGANEVRRASPDSLKATFIYKFAHFVAWPETAATEVPGELWFCVLERPALASKLGEVVENRTVRNRSLRVRAIERGQPLDRCGVLFVGRAAAAYLDELFAELAGQPILTVGETHHFAQRGGMIHLLEHQRRLRFEINRETIESAGLRPASQLLRLGSPVRGEAERD